MSRLLFAIAGLAPLWLLAGCGDPAKTVSGQSKKDHMVEIGEMMKSLAEERKKPPSKMADLESVEPMLPLAGPLIRSGEIVYLWGAEYAAGSSKIAAHEKKAATEGGWVLLQDGTAKEMTADEFKSAPKAR